MVSIGQKAPDFIAPAVIDGRGVMFELFAEVATHEAVVLVFQPADFVPTGTAELRAIRDAGWHEHEDLLVVGLTGDSLYSHFAYADQFGLPMPLVSDFHGGIAASYDLLLEEWEGHSDIPGRATVVVDGDWDLRAIESIPPLDEQSTPPPVRVTDVLGDLGIAVTEPAVTYDL